MIAFVIAKKISRIVTFTLENYVLLIVLIGGARLGQGTVESSTNHWTTSDNSTVSQFYIRGKQKGFYAPLLSGSPEQPQDRKPTASRKILTMGFVKKPK